MFVVASVQAYQAGLIACWSVGGGNVASDSSGWEEGRTGHCQIGSHTLIPSAG